MKAWRFTSPGAEPAIESLALPAPGPGEVQVRIAAAGLNFADLLMAEGRYQDTPALPYTPGLECAGVVAALGPGTAAPPVGSRVAVFSGAGALAEAGNFPATAVFAVPARMSFAEAAAFPIAYGTSHLALSRRAALSPGETLFVTGAAGGVGLTAVEIGKLMGARVIASARGTERLAVAAAAGADHLVDSDAPDLRGTLKALGGIDVLYDTVGGPAFHEALRAARPEGRLLAIGFAGGEVPQVPANLLLVKNLTVIGFYFGGYRGFRPQALADSLRTLFDWFDAGRLRPHVGNILPFAGFPAGLELLRSRKATGKVVIRMPGFQDE